MGEAFKVDCAAAAHEAEDTIALGEQEFGKIGAVLAGNAGDEGSFFHGVFLQRLSFTGVFFPRTPALIYLSAIARSNSRRRWRRVTAMPVDMAARCRPN